MIEIKNVAATAIVTMCHGKANALNIEFLNVLLKTVEDLEKSDSVHAVVLTGTGSIFGAGVDLPALVEGGPAYVRTFVPLMQLVFERLARFRKPLIAAVNGHAIAGGAIIMFCCDQRLLTVGKAQIGLTESKVGVIFPAWALEISRFMTPIEHLSTLILTGKTWSAEESLRRGLVDELVEPDRLIERACEVAAELSNIPAEVFGANKMALRSPLFEAAEAAAKRTNEEIIEYWCSEKTLANINEFAKRAIKVRPS